MLPATARERWPFFVLRDSCHAAQPDQPVFAANWLGTLGWWLSPPHTWPLHRSGGCRAIPHGCGIGRRYVRVLPPTMCSNSEVGPGRRTAQAKRNGEMGE